MSVVSVEGFRFWVTGFLVRVVPDSEQVRAACPGALVVRTRWPAASPPPRLAGDCDSTIIPARCGARIGGGRAAAVRAGPSGGRRGGARTLDPPSGQHLRPHLHHQAHPTRGYPSRLSLDTGTLVIFGRRPGRSPCGGTWNRYRDGSVFQEAELPQAQDSPPGPQRQPAASRPAAAGAAGPGRRSGSCRGSRGRIRIGRRSGSWPIAWLAARRTRRGGGNPTNAFSPGPAPSPGRLAWSIWRRKPARSSAMSSTTTFSRRRQVFIRPSGCVPSRRRPGRRCARRWPEALMTGRSSGRCCAGWH